MAKKGIIEKFKHAKQKMGTKKPKICYSEY
jgi:hypothetical protein